MITTSECPVCGQKFIKKRSITCSKVCTGRLSYLKRAGRLDFDKKVCDKCGIEKLGKEFFGSKKKYWNWCKSCFLEKKGSSYKKVLESDKWQLLKKVEEVIKHLKTKRLYADTIDILKLIDVYCDVFPNELYNPKTADDEELFNIMLFKIVSWRNANRDKIVKNL